LATCVGRARLAFTKVGWSERRIDKFGWRIDAIKTSVCGLGTCRVFR
jgi:hypothetical protein